MASGAVDEVAGSAGAGEGDVVKKAASYAGGALGRVSGVADGAVKGRAGVALEGLGGVEVEAGEASAGAVIGIVPKTGLGVAVDAGGDDLSGIETGISWAGGDAASSVGVIGLQVLGENDIGEQVLILSLTSSIGNSDDHISSGRVDVKSLEDLTHSSVGSCSVIEDSSGCIG